MKWKLDDSHEGKRKHERDLRFCVDMAGLYDAFQKGVKIVMNSVYGFTGIPSHKGRLSCMEIAASITASGRKIIKATSRAADNFNLVSLLKKGGYERNGTGTIVKTSNPKEVIPDTDYEEGIEAALNRLNGPREEYVDDAGGDTDSYFKLIMRSLIKPTGNDDAVEFLGKTNAFYVNRCLPTLLTIPLGGELDCTIGNYYDRVKQRRDTQELQWEHSICTWDCHMKKMRSGVTKANGVEESFTKGHSSKRSDGLPWYQKLEKEILATIHDTKNTDRGAAIVAGLLLINRRLNELIGGQYDFNDFVISKLMKMNLYEYKGTLPEHVQVAKDMITRGDSVEAGTRIHYVYARPSKVSSQLMGQYLGNAGSHTRVLSSNYHGFKGSELAVEANYAAQQSLELDMGHYIDVVILPKLTSLTSTWFAHPNSYPKIPEDASEIKTKELEGVQDWILNAQTNAMEKIVISSIVKKQLALGQKYPFQQQLKKNGQESIVKVIKGEETRISVCQSCTRYFEATTRLGKTKEICNDCSKTGRTITVKNFKEKLKQEQKKMDNLLDTCQKCIDSPGLAKDPKTGTYMIEYRDCIRTACKIHKERTGCSKNITAIESKKRKIESLSW